MINKQYSTETLEAMLRVLQSIDKGEVSLDAARAQIETYKSCRDQPLIGTFLDMAEHSIANAARRGKNITKIFQELCDLRAEYQRN